MLLGNQYPDFFNNPDYWFIDEVIKTGDLPKHEKVNQPARHFFEGQELQQLLNRNGFEQIELAGSPCFSCGNADKIEILKEDKKAMETIMLIEIETYTKSTMVDNGEFLMARAKKFV